MKRFCILFIVLNAAIGFAQNYVSHTTHKKGLSITLSEGVLHVEPLSPKAININWEKGLVKEEQELILVNEVPIPEFKISETSRKIKLSTASVTVTFNKKNGILEYSDSKGKVFLTEKAGSRKLEPASVMGQDCFEAQQSFITDKDESLFGLGQFQDGNYNLRNITRRLVQVNTQIAIPFLYSSKGYGILWHQYGLTDFNPADNAVLLTKSNDAGNKQEAEVTTTAGTQKVSQQQSAYTGTFSVPVEGDYSIMLDLGAMENRHFLAIDGVPFIDQSNLWLPPAAGRIIHLKAGTHTTQIICRSTNVPKLTYKAADNITTFRSPNAKSLRYVVFYGEDADDVISGYRNLSGNVPMLPLWAYGFWQCRERYTSGEHLVKTVKEFRERNLPMDVIVQDWQYWGKYGWGVPKFDETNYPNPEGFIKELHGLNAHFSVSVWENLNKDSEVAKPYRDKNLYIPNSPWIDIYNPETQQTHWDALNENLFSKGVDSWWMDATEPENDALAGKQTYLGPGDFYRLTYPMFVSKAVYNGQRETDPSKRVAILTRSAFAGQQRYGTINWSGDIGWDWDTYQRQIVAGLNYNLTGMPYWTTDIGGFFRPGPGQYTDEKYHEILTRWFQWGVFNPIFRIHGYQTETEPWKYGPTVEANMREMMNLRYRLLPYIYSEAWQVHKNGSTIMRALVMDFSHDARAVEQPLQYMFGPELLVAPVTKPGIQQWDVYLPKGAEWYNFWTGEKYKGGQTISAAAPLNKIPVYVKSGAILPMGKVIQHTAEAQKDTIEIRVYKGADGRFELYEDEGDNYNYETGKYIIIPFIWDEKNKTLTIKDMLGGYEGCLKERTFTIVFVTAKNGVGTAESYAERQITYTGKEIIINEK
jgi:alpha-D-xyloside xylohydrolase